MIGQYFQNGLNCNKNVLIYIRFFTGVLNSYY